MLAQRVLSSVDFNSVLPSGPPHLGKGPQPSRASPLFPTDPTRRPVPRAPGGRGPGPHEGAAVCPPPGDTHFSIHGPICLSGGREDSALPTGSLRPSRGSETTGTGHETEAHAQPGPSRGRMGRGGGCWERRLPRGPALGGLGAACGPESRPRRNTMGRESGARPAGKGGLPSQAAHGVPAGGVEVKGRPRGLLWSPHSQHSSTGAILEPAIRTSPCAPLHPGPHPPPDRRAEAVTALPTQPS